MKITGTAKSNLQSLGIVAGILLLLFVLFKIQSLLVYIFIAGVISLIFRPVTVFFNYRLKIPKTISAVLTLLLVVAFLSFMIKIFLPIIVQQGKNISEIDFDVVKQDLNELNIQASDYLGVEQINIVEAIKDTDFIRDFNSEFIAEFIAMFFANIGYMIAGIFSVLFISFFLLRDAKLINRVVASFSSPGKEKRFLSVLKKSRSLLSRYFVGLTLQTLIVATLYIILLLYADVDNFLAIALICAFLNIVPYLGPIIGCIVMMLVVISNNLANDFSSVILPKLIIILIGVCVVQIIDNALSQPLIFSKSVKSHPLEIFIVIIMSGLLFGIPGMILAIPVYTTIKVISKEFLSEYKIVKQLTRNM